MLVRGLLSTVLCLTLFSSFVGSFAIASDSNAKPNGSSKSKVGDKNSRTWAQPDYEKDRFKNKNHIFGIFDEVKGYTDPDFQSAQILSSPLSDLKFESYDVAVIINIKNSKDSLTQAPIQGQTLRIYARNSVLNNIGYDRFQATNYDPTTGLLFYWKTSTAREGKSTPRGYFRPQAFSSNHFSSLYNDAPMPWALFFNGSIATHGVLGAPIANLGKAASAGCARLEPQRAEDLFNLIGIVGKGWVDKINQAGEFSYLPEGSIEQEINWKTLISVR